MKCGGFRLHKWISNSSEVLSAIPECDRAVKTTDMEFDQQPVQRALGLKWNISDDHFIFDQRLKHSSMTKRGVVSTVSSIFNPCGCLAPFTLRAKCIIQELWRERLDWDDPLPEKRVGKSGSWNWRLDSFKHHPDLSSSLQWIELHVFCDASEKGFGAVVYFRFDLQLSDFYDQKRQHRMEEAIAEHIDYSSKSITFHQDFSFYMQALHLFSSPERQQLIDQDVLQDLQQARVLNWCRTADQIYPVRTKSDGNCLCHAVSTAIWGVPDDRLTLRNLLYVSIDAEGNKERWRMYYENQGLQSNRDSLHLSKNEWEKEWSHVIETASSAAKTSSAAAIKFAHLEAIHIFSLANILRRPIIVLADSTARTVSGGSLQESDISGIYLPLGRPPLQCHKYPVFLGYTMSHFCPLLPQEKTERSTFTVPIVARDGSALPIRFLTSDEEKRAAFLLKTYLKIKEVPLSTSDTLSLVLSTEIKNIPLPDTSNTFTVMPQDTITASKPIASTAVLARTGFEPVPCITPGCKFFGSSVTGNMCSGCLNKYLQQEGQRLPAVRASATEPSAPPPSMPLSSEYVDVSMMGETCKQGCGYRCSTHTYPYCHECAERQRTTGSPSHPSTVAESSLFGAGRESSTCRGEGCHRQGKTQLGELCDRCFMGRKKQICSSPGCTGLRTDTGYCLSCGNTAATYDHRGLPNSVRVSGQESADLPVVDDRAKQAVGLSERQEEAVPGGQEGSSSLIESGIRCNTESVKPPVITGPEDKIQCASPMCSTLIYPPKKLCPRCIDILMQSQVSHVPNTQQLQQMLEPTVVSIRQEELSQAPTARSQSTPVAIRQHMMRVHLAEPSRPSSAPIGRKCLTPDCTRFGDPSTDDLCTSCYQTTLGQWTGAVRSSSVGSENMDPFQAMMTRVERQKRFPRQCKAAHCCNYGNPSNEGFCNSCYPRYQMMKQNLTH